MKCRAEDREDYITAKMFVWRHMAGRAPNKADRAKARKNFRRLIRKSPDIAALNGFGEQVVSDFAGPLDASGGRMKKKKNGQLPKTKPRRTSVKQGEKTCELCGEWLDEYDPMTGDPICSYCAAKLRDVFRDDV